MTSHYPNLHIKKGDSTIGVFEIKPQESDYKYIIGRETDDAIIGNQANGVRLDQNHIRLCDKEKIISREHCTLTRRIEGWFVIDHSRNGTILVRNSHQIKIHELEGRKCLITDGDCIFVEDWELIFCDPETTINKKLFLPPSYPWVFNVSQQSLYKIEKEKRKKVAISPQATKMLEYMALQNINNDNKPVTCVYKVLIEAIWGENIRGVTSKQIHPIVQKIREVFDEHGSDDPKQLLETKLGEGYRLNIYCED